MSARYIGRFAPSPTGPLHAGSLLAALASFLDARAAGGRWLLRIEDVDKHRSVKGASDAILRSLETHGLRWDGDIAWQRERDARYETALQQLAVAERIFYCNCTRKNLRSTRQGKPHNNEGVYPGYCRARRHCDYQPASATGPASHAIRFDVSGLPALQFEDRVLGTQRFDLHDLGDFIVRRRDGLFAYQLAVVVDDAEQGITDVVRGQDLLDSTPWQIALQQAFGYSTPRYAHLPLLLHAANGAKLSKQTGAPALDDSCAAANLLLALQRLGQVLPVQSGDTLPCPDEILDHAVANWSLQKMPRKAISISL
ncbi:MAG: tRNA glutamyl-Q(34) synthetase GluQRS [Pseudomonadales bacterium]